LLLRAPDPHFGGPFHLAPVPPEASPLTETRARPPRQKKAKASPLKLPAGLTSLSATLRVSEDAVSFDALEKFVKGVDHFEARAAVRGVRGVLVGGRALPGGHAHVTIDYVKAEKRFQIEVEVFNGPHGPRLKGMSIADFFGGAGVWLRSGEKNTTTLLGANLALSLDDWSPVFDLPFTPAGITAQMPGLPKIAGVDFSFEQQTETQHLHRAFITTYDEIKRMVVRVLLTYDQPWDEGMLPASVTLVAAHLPILVKKRGDNAGA